MHLEVVLTCEEEGQLQQLEADLTLEAVPHVIRSDKVYLGLSSA